LDAVETEKVKSDAAAIAFTTLSDKIAAIKLRIKHLRDTNDSNKGYIKDTTALKDAADKAHGEWVLF